MTETKKHKPNWFFYERFSWFDLIAIFIVMTILDAIQSHLHIFWS